jgi:chromatin segregation and condensation protein Rec8/ScpA/Scc1 (kleisin family)
MGKDHFKRPLPDEREKREQLLKEMNLTDLTVAFQEMLMRARKPSIRVKKDRMSIAQAATKIANRLGSQEITDFQSLFSDDVDRNEVVVTFLAILELGRLQKIRVLQHQVYGTIYVVLRDRINYDLMQKLFETGDAYAYTRPAELPARAKKALARRPFPLGNMIRV